MQQLVDSPIVSPESDLFRLSPFARRLARLIRSGPAAGGLVIGLSGGPGSGKASVINMASAWLIAMDQSGLDRLGADETAEDEAMSDLLRSLPLPVQQQHLSELEAGSGGPGCTLLMRYDPWLASGLSLQVSDFFRQLGRRIGTATGGRDGENIRQAAEHLADLLDAARPGGRRAPSPGRGLAGLFRKPPLPPTLAESHRMLAERLQRLATDQRILVILPDLSQLPGDEAHAMLSLVGRLGRLPGVSYLISYDRAVLAERLSRAAAGISGDLIDKTVSTPLEMPRPAPVRLLDSLIEKASMLFDAELADGERGDLVQGFRHAPPLLDSPRAAARLANALAFSDAATGRSLRISDLIRMEMLRLGAPDLHDWLMRNAIHFHPRGSLASLGGTRDRSFLTEGLALVDPEHRHSAEAILAATFPALFGVQRVSERLHDSETRYPIASAEGFEIYLAASPAAGILTQDEWQQLSDIRKDAVRSRAFVQTLLQRKRDDGKPLLFTLLSSINRLPTTGGEPLGLLTALMELPDSVLAESADGSHRSALRDGVALIDYFDDPEEVLQALVLKDSINPFAVAVILEVLSERSGLTKAGRLKPRGPVSDEALVELIATLSMRIASLPPDRIANWFLTVDLFKLLQLGIGKPTLHALAQKLLARNTEALRFLLLEICTPWPDGNEIVHLLTHRPDPQLYPLEDMQAYAVRMLRLLPSDPFFMDFAEAAAEFIADGNLRDRTSRIRARLKA